MTYNWRQWLKANGHDLAPVTGTDSRALAALEQMWELYAYTRSADILKAIALVLRRMQETTRHLGIELAAKAMDWTDRDALGPMVLQRAKEGVL